MKKFLTIITILLFLMAIFHPDSKDVVTMIFRWLVTFVACAYALKYYKSNLKIAAIFAVVAFLYFPISFIPLEEKWRFFCLVTGIVFLPFAFDRFLPFAMSFLKEKPQETPVNTEEAEETKPEERDTAPTEPKEENQQN